MARTVAQAFNEWMDRFTNHPEEYNREFQSVIQFKQDQANDVEPSYGADCAAYLQHLIDGE